MICFRCVDFEMLTEHPGSDVQQAAGDSGWEFKRDESWIYASGVIYMKIIILTMGYSNNTKTENRERGPTTHTWEVEGLMILQQRTRGEQCHIKWK